MKFLTLAVFALVCAFSQAEYTQLLISSCSTQTPALTIYGITMSPMPVVNPGSVKLGAKVDLLRGFQGKIKTNINIVRTVSGLSLPVRCFLSNGAYFGSCIYDDLCEMIKIYNDAVLGTPFDTICPFDVPAGLVDSSISFDLPDLAGTDAAFLANGDYDLQVTATDSVGYVGCIDLKFSTKN